MQELFSDSVHFKWHQKTHPADRFDFEKRVDYSLIPFSYLMQRRIKRYPAPVFPPCLLVLVFFDPI